MRTINQISCLFIAFWCWTSIASAQPSSHDIPVVLQDKPAVQVTSAQPQFTLKMRSNPTTGYSWYLRDYDATMIAPVKHVFEAPTNKKLMGAPGFELWTFRVKPSGFTVPQQTLIRFIYSRPWQMNDGSAQVVFQVTTVAVESK